jgi:integrase
MQTLDQATATYCQTNPRIVSRQTIRRYGTTVSGFTRWLGRPVTLADLTPDNFGRWIRHRRDVDRVAAGTVRGDAEKLLVLWRWWAERAGVPLPRVVLPPPADNEPTTWTRGELARLEQAAGACRWNVGRVPGAIYWPAILGVCLDTAERIAAVHALATPDLDLDRRVVTYRAITRKGQRGSITRPVSPQTAAAVARLLAVRPVDPFAPVAAASLYGPLRRLVLEAGLPYGRTRAFHALRRYHATSVHRQGGDATAALGHRDERTTRRHYLDRSQLPVVLPERGRGWWGWAFG